MRTIKWKASDPNKDELTFDIYYREVSEKDWKPLKENIRNETSYKWDTARVPAGRYLLKFVAKDNLARSPAEALSDEKVTAPFIVDNRAPEVLELRAKRRGDGCYEITGVAKDGLSLLVSIQVSHNAGDWEAAFPDDGLFDATLEPFSFTTEKLEPGEHVFVFAATDDAKNTGSGKIVLTVPGQK